HLKALAYSNGLPKSRVNEVLDLVGMREVADKRIKGFSLGMSQRLRLPPRMLRDPQSLMFDRPGNGAPPPGLPLVRPVLPAPGAPGGSAGACSARRPAAGPFSCPAT